MREIAWESDQCPICKQKFSPQYWGLGSQGKCYYAGGVADATKWDAKTGAVRKKYQARLNIHGTTSMKNGLHFKKMHSLLATCASLRMLLTLTVDHCWCTVQLDVKHPPFAHAPAKTMLQTRWCLVTMCQWYFAALRIEAGRSLVFGTNPW